jgi:type VI secretion system protein ImpA
LELSARSKDLRVAIYLLRAELALEGLSGFANALELIQGYVVQYWSSVHPQLDPVDDNDPRIRVSALASLCDVDTVLRSLRMAPLSQSKQFGRISWRDYAIAHGQIPVVPGEDAANRPDATRIEAAFADTPQQVVEEAQTAAVRALQSVTAISASLQSTVGAGNGPDFEPLRVQLTNIKSLLDNELAKRGGGEAAVAPSQPVLGAAGGGATGAIRNRGDVVAALDRICRYYQEYEPSSPIPPILERTKRLVSLGFLDILKELTPEGVERFGMIAGIKERE